MGLNIMDTAPKIQIYDNRPDCFKASTRIIAEQMISAINLRGRAVLALSGGSTPIPVYEALSKLDLPWENVTVVLVDERVTHDEAGSNMSMIKAQLQQRKAAKVSMIGLEDERAVAALAPFDLCLMGMGTDGHTASWFPGSIGLKKALDPAAENFTASIHANGCPGAGSYPNRLTLTLPAVMDAKALLLLMTGKEKRDVFESAVQADSLDKPVKALMAAGKRLTVIWAP